MRVYPKHQLNSFPCEIVRRLDRARQLLNERAVAPAASLVVLGGCFAIAHAPAFASTPLAKAEPTQFLIQKPFEPLPPPTHVKQDYRGVVIRRREVDGYLVFVDRYSPNLLAVVQRVERSATRVRFRGRDVIQLGVYRNQSTAERLVRDLERRGILAEFATVDVQRFARLLLVFIPSSDPRLLREVRVVAPGAFMINYRGRAVIRAGIFENEVRAAQLAKRLRDRRLIAQIVPIEFEESWARFEPVEERRFEVQNDEDFYSVIIPCREEELPAIAAQIRQMAPDMNMEQAISMRNESDGSYVMVGPFRNREMAENWNRYLRDFGMENAQVYYGR
jgi:hypothetical protein